MPRLNLSVKPHQAQVLDTLLVSPSKLLQLAIDLLEEGATLPDFTRGGLFLDALRARRATLPLAPPEVRPATDPSPKDLRASLKAATAPLDPANRVSLAKPAHTPDSTQVQARIQGPTYVRPIRTTLDAALDDPDGIDLIRADTGDLWFNVDHVARELGHTQAPTGAWAAELGSTAATFEDQLWATLSIVEGMAALCRPLPGAYPTRIDKVEAWCQAQAQSVLDLKPLPIPTTVD